MTQHKTLIIIGAGGHGRVVADCAKSIGCYTNIMFLDDCFAERKNNHAWQVVGPIENWLKYLNSADFIVAVGNNTLRASLLQQLIAAKANITTLIHPSAVVSKQATIADGVVVFANAVINIGTRIDEGCIINTGATIDHDCHIHDYCHISPGVNVAGGVEIGSYSWLGIGSTVIEYITIAQNTQTGAGAVVTKATKNNTLYVGIPARPVRSLI